MWNDLTLFPEIIIYKQDLTYPSNDNCMFIVFINFFVSK